jgi:hypothetical protein
MPRAGTALLPLHYGRVPEWLATRMARLGRVIVEAIVLEYGRDEVLRRLAHPHWFQSFGAVMGMDWHSSGITTSVLGALKRGLAPVAWELGLHVCGGRGKESRKTPAELAAIGERTGFDGDALARASRLVAKVDGAAVQDGYDLYLHGFVVTDDGRWTVVQQGMNGGEKMARRYHWLSEGLASFVEAPHAAIDGVPSPAPIVNLTDVRAARAREAQIALVGGGPDAIVSELARIRDSARRGVTAPLPLLQMPAHHEVLAEDVVLRRMHAALAVAHERGPRTFEALLETPGVGARTLFSLSLVAEVVHGAPARFSDPARYSLAHGGKDGHPYPVPLKVYDRTILVLKNAIARAKLGNDDRLAALKKLDAEARRLERIVRGETTFDELVQEERRRSRSLGGMTVAGPARRPAPRAPREQLTLRPSPGRKASS